MMLASRKTQLAAAAVVALGCTGRVGALLTMEKVGGFAGEEDSASFEVVAVKPSTNVSLLSRCRRVLVRGRTSSARRNNRVGRDGRWEMREMRANCFAKMKNEKIEARWR